LSLKDLAERLIAANGGQGRYEIKEFPADRAPIDIGSFAADDRAFRAATGWWPRVELDEGLRRSLDWYRPRLAEYVA
jgi:UDP-glucose 4-epimerase